MNKFKDNIIIILLIFSIGLSIYTLVKIQKAETRNMQILQQGLMNRRDRSGKVVDPYIKDQVKNTITKKSGELLDCYRVYLDRTNAKEKKEGKVTMDWQVDIDGTVISPEIVGSAIPDDAFAQCLVEKIKKWNFPSPPFNQKKYVEHTFNFIDKK